MFTLLSIFAAYAGIPYSVLAAPSETDPISILYPSHIHPISAYIHPVLSVHRESPLLIPLSGRHTEPDLSLPLKTLKARPGFPPDLTGFGNL